MRIGVLNSVMCLIGLQTPQICMAQINWKNAKNVHYSNTLQQGRTVSATQDFSYFANELSNEPNFKSHLEKILVPRPVGSVEHQIVREHIGNTMKKEGWTVEEHAFNDQTPLGNKKFTNVIATLDPSAPRRMVIACHYDSLERGKDGIPGFLGATDSAVPCAMMLNMAKTMKQELIALKGKGGELTLQFLFFDGEEAFVRWTSTDSIYGSRELAKTWENQGYSHAGTSGNHNDRIDIFVLLDLLGAKGMQLSKLERTTSDWYDRLVHIERSLQRKNFIGGQNIFKDQFVPAGIEDDHIPFKRRGVPILHLIATPFPKEWHKIGDNKQSLDFNKIANLNKILRVFVAEYLHINP